MKKFLEIFKSYSLTASLSLFVIILVLTAFYRICMHPKQKQYLIDNHTNPQKTGRIMPKKINRLEAIKELIKSQAIEDQQTLVQLIKDKYGIDTNQSILSRDLRAMGVVKRAVGGKLIYELEESDASREILRLAVVNVEHNESLIVVKTLPGLAAFVADFLDMQEELEIIGTIAGENTLFITPQSVKNIEKIYKEVRKILYIK